MVAQPEGNGFKLLIKEGHNHIVEKQQTSPPEKKRKEMKKKKKKVGVKTSQREKRGEKLG